MKYDRIGTFQTPSKAISASRMEGRETPNCFASSRSAGRRLRSKTLRLQSRPDLIGDLQVKAARLDDLYSYGKELTIAGVN